MSYGTIREAAIAALTQTLPRTKAEGVEFGGNIDKTPDGRYTYTVVRGDDNSVEFAPQPNTVGAYHTHPGSAGDWKAATMSNNDLVVASFAARKGVLYHYLGSAGDGSVYEAYLPSPQAVRPLLVAQDGRTPLSERARDIYWRVLMSIVQAEGPSAELAALAMLSLVGLPPVRGQAQFIGRVPL